MTNKRAAVVKHESFIGLDLFAGAGGMSLGAEWAGVSVKYAVEKDIFAAQTYKEGGLH